MTQEIDDHTAIAQAKAKVLDAALSWWFARRAKPAPKVGVEADLWAAVAVLRRHLGARARAQIEAELRLNAAAVMADDVTAPNPK